jgi:hypothetical protein
MRAIRLRAFLRAEADILPIAKKNGEEIWSIGDEFFFF